MTDEIQFTQVGAARVGYAVHGEGELDIVYAPGLASHLDLTIEQPRYLRYIESLMRFGRVIRFDRRGAGVSDPVPANAYETWEMWVDDLAGVLEAVGSRRVAIIAANDVGSAAVMFAAMRPDLVQHLVLFNTSARFLVADDYPEGHPPEVGDLVLQALQGSWGTEASAELLAPSLAADEPFRRWYARFQRAACPPGEMVENVRRIMQFDSRKVLPEVRCPTLVLHRADYPVLPVEQGRALAAGITGAQFEVFPGADAPIYTQGMSDLVDRIGAFLGTPVSPASDDTCFRTVLFTDIVSSTERAVSLGDEAWRRLLDSHDGAAREAVQLHGGRVIKTTGDGLLAMFDGTTAALRCAEEIRAREHDLGIQVCAGVHAGPVSIRLDGDISGVAVNVAARVLGQASSGEVLVSEAVTGLVTGDEFEFADVGERPLKGLPGSWRIFRARSSEQLVPS